MCLKLEPSLQHLKNSLDSLNDISESTPRSFHQNKVNNLRKKDSEHVLGIIKPRGKNLTLRKKMAHMKKNNSQSFDSLSNYYLKKLLFLYI